MFLQVDNASKNYGDITLFNNITFTINEADKVALVARNGTGKTTLLNILSGKDTFDSGTYYLNPDLKIGYLEQDPRFDPDFTVFETIYSAPGKLMETVRNYEQALHEHNQKDLEKASAQMDFHDAWDLDARIRQMLGILNLNDESQNVGTLSGGQVKRLALAVALLNEPHFLILDEPTNHLDLYMIEWLEEYLTKTHLTLLMVTHDRYFLDRICNEIIEIDEGNAYIYRGNYKLFLQKRGDRLFNKALNAEKAQNLLHTELEWMRRMPKARSTKAKYRIDAFYDLQQQAAYRHNDRQVDINVKTARLGKKILILDKISKSFDNTVILEQFSYTFTRGEKVGIIGRNGVGKTTFLNLITGMLAPDSGKLEQGETVVYGYYEQRGLEFAVGQRVMDIIREIAEVITLRDGRQVTASQFLSNFLFTPEMQYVQVEKLSGGEKRRLYLMTVLMRNPNFLILDEPTNDFDIVTLNILEEYLRSFGGCLIIVSHDRFFMDKLVDHLFIFEGDGLVYDFPGNYSDFRAFQKRQNQSSTAPPNTQAQTSTQTAPLQTPTPSTKKKPTFREKREFELLTAEIVSLEQEKSSIETALGSGKLSSDALLQKSHRMAELLKLIDEKTDRWLELSEKQGVGSKE
jgi:ATP-binding cassette subfamily F protein uup